jgi:hypothetical protein
LIDLERELRLLEALKPKDDKEESTKNGEGGVKVVRNAEEYIRGDRRKRGEGLSDGQDDGPSVEELLERIAKLRERFNPKDKRELN